MLRLIVLGVLAITATFLAVFNLTLLIEIVVPLALYEVAAITSALLDYRESRLACVGWAQWLAVGHATVFARIYRRVRHHVRGLQAGWHRRQLRKAAAPPAEGYVVLDPTAPFTGRLIDPEPQDARRETA